MRCYNIISSVIAALFLSYYATTHYSYVLAIPSSSSSASSCDNSDDTSSSDDGTADSSGDDNSGDDSSDDESSSDDGTADSSSGDDSSSSDDTSNTRHDAGWVSRPIPTDAELPGIDDLPDIVKYINWSRPRCANLIKGNCAFCTPKQTTAWNAVSNTVMNEAEEFYHTTPEEIERLLHKFIKTDTVCVYLKTIDSNNIEVKVGESGQCRIRVIVEQDGENTINFNFMPVEDMEYEQFIGNEVIDKIMEEEILSKLPITAGMCLEDNFERIRFKIVRQVGEMNPTCSYDVRQGNILEWLLRSPSEREHQFLHVNDMITDMEGIMGEVKDLFGNEGPFDGIVNIDTWPTEEAARQEPDFDNVTPFKHPDRKEGITPYLVRHNVDEALSVEFVNAYKECPYFEKMSEVVSNINNLMNTHPRPANLKEELKNAFNSAPSDTYQYPDKAALAQATIDELERIFNGGVNYQSKLIVVRDIAMKYIRTHDETWYETNFPETDSGVITDKKLVTNEAGDNVDIVQDDSALILYKTPSCHRVLVVKSHFLMFAPPGSVRAINRQNAIRNYLLQTVFYYKVGLAKQADVYRIWKMMTSTLLLLDGIRGSINIVEGGGGSVIDAMYYVLPKRSRPRLGLGRGQHYLQKAFPYTGNGQAPSDEVGDEADYYDNDGDDENNIATTQRKHLPWAGIVYIMSKVGHIRFNDILEVMELVGIDINEVVGKYFLRINGKYYWDHYDEVNGYDYLKEAKQIAMDHQNGNYEAEILPTMYWDEDNKEWLVDIDNYDNEESINPLLEAVYDTLTALYDDADECNNKHSLMKSRFRKLIDELGMNGVEIYDEFSLSSKYSVLDTFFSKVDDMNNGIGGSLHPDENKYYIPTETNMKKYWADLRKRNTATAQKIKETTEGTRYEHLLDGSQLKELTNKSKKRKEEDKVRNNKRKRASSDNARTLKEQDGEAEHAGSDVDYCDD